MKNNSKKVNPVWIILLTCIMAVSLCSCSQGEDTTVNLIVSNSADASSLYITGLVKNYFSGVYTYAYFSDDIAMTTEKLEKEKLQRACVIAYMTVDQYKTVVARGTEHLKIVLIDNYTDDQTIHGFWVAREDWIEQNGETYKKTVKALLKAMNYRSENMKMSYEEAMDSIESGYDIEYETDVMQYIAIYAKENEQSGFHDTSQNSVQYIPAADMKLRYDTFADGTGAGYQECLALYEIVNGKNANREEMAQTFDFTAVKAADLTVKTATATTESKPSTTAIILVVVFAVAVIGAVYSIVYTLRKLVKEKRYYDSLDESKAKQNTQKKGRKKLFIVLGTVVLLAVICFVVITVILPVGLETDIDSISPVGTNVVVKEAQNGEPVSLYKTDDKPFKILTFTDTHLDKKKENTMITVKYLVKAIQDEAPDLVVINGDVVTADFNAKRLKQFCEIMEKLEVYWIVTLGNHEGDNILSISRESFVDRYASYPHCLIENDKKTTSDGNKVWGNGNTQLNILTTEGKVVQSLFFLDSGDTISKDDAEQMNIDSESEDFLKASQITWYRERVSLLPTGTKSMLFIHIPLCEYKEAYETSAPVFGQKNEGICCSDFNSGMFNAILQADSTQAVIAGHDHVNTFRIEYKDVLLCYNRSSGFSSYNMVTKGLSDTLEQGATVYQIGADGSLTIEDLIYSSRYDLSDAYQLYQ